MPVLIRVLLLLALGDLLLQPRCGFPRHEPRGDSLNQVGLGRFELALGNQGMDVKRGGVAALGPNPPVLCGP